MISCMFNEWADNYVEKYMQSGKLKRIFLKLRLKQLYYSDKEEGYQNVLAHIKMIE